jgi:hypothetical protein
MIRISLSCLFGAALTLALASGCNPATSNSSKGSGIAEVLVLEMAEIEILPGTEKDIKVTTGKAESAEAPKESGLMAKVADGKVTVSAAKDAKEGTHDVKVKDAKGKDATVKVKVKKDAAAK